MQHSRRVVLVTGASSGIGKAIADVLLAKGYTVYGTSRTGHAPDAGDAPRYPALLRLDVREDESAAAVVRAVLLREGRLDVLVNNAGFGIAGAVEDTAVDEAKAQFETGFFGALRMIRQVLPGMRARRGGLIVNISSIAGLLAVPYQGLYSAAKFALEGLSEALRLELAPFGVQVTLVEPGDIRTGFTQSRRATRATGEASPYWPHYQKAIAAMEKSEQAGPPPDALAKKVARIIRRKNPPVRVQSGLIYHVAAQLKAAWLSRLALWLMKRFY